MNPKGLVSQASNYRGRFAPSPTGRMHVGNIISSLTAWILAKRAGGSVVMRIDDLDQERSRPIYTTQLLADYEFLGLDYEGKPLYQSQRAEAYLEALEALKSKGLIYPCFCTRAELRAASAPHLGESNCYPGLCRKLSLGEQEVLSAAFGRKAHLRLNLSGADPVNFVDKFQGFTQLHPGEVCGDPVLQRRDGNIAYHLACVLDDSFQGVNAVVRGCDLLASSALQIHLGQLLGLSGARPEYAHVPLLVAADGHRLSKRYKDIDMASLKERYKTPEILLGALAYACKLIPEPCAMSAEGLLRYADLDVFNGNRKIVYNDAK